MNGVQHSPWSVRGEGTDITAHALLQEPPRTPKAPFLQGGQESHFSKQVENPQLFTILLKLYKISVADLHFKRNLWKNFKKL